MLLGKMTFFDSKLPRLISIQTFIISDVYFSAISARKLPVRDLTDVITTNRSPGSHHKMYHNTTTSMLPPAFKVWDENLNFMREYLHTQMDCFL